jgi:hypothetical protein
MTTEVDLNDVLNVYYTKDRRNRHVMYRLLKIARSLDNRTNNVSKIKTKFMVVTRADARNNRVNIVEEIDNYLLTYVERLYLDTLIDDNIIVQPRILTVVKNLKNMFIKSLRRQGLTHDGIFNNDNNNNINNNIPIIRGRPALEREANSVFFRIINNYYHPPEVEERKSNATYKNNTDLDDSKGYYNTGPRAGKWKDFEYKMKCDLKHVLKQGHSFGNEDSSENDESELETESETETGSESGHNFGNEDTDESGSEYVKNEEYEPEDCSICNQEFKNCDHVVKHLAPNCNVKMHYNCLIKWYYTQNASTNLLCPFCRRSFGR